LGSYSKRAPKGREAKVTRPDTENVVKAVLDAGTGTLWHDDSQVWRLIAWKEIGAQDEAPFVRLTVSDGVA
jgi:Holliday junction resolvase RusA-like endonuclease